MAGETTTDTPTADPPQAWAGWRERPLADIDFGNSVLNHQLHHAGCEQKTLGDLEREVRLDPAAPPLRLCDVHRTLVEDRLDELAAGDPAYLPFTAADTPVIVEGSPAVDLDPASHDGLALYDRETAALVSEAEDEVSALEATWGDRHGEASLAKKEFENARDKMRSLIRERKANRGKKPEPTLFDRPADVDEASAPSEDKLFELSQLYPLDFAHWEEFGLTEKDVEKLNAGETKHHGSIPLRTLGDVGRYTKPSADGYERRLTDIKGIGPGAFERWEAANLAFWAKWPNGKAISFAAEIGFDLGGAADASVTDAGSGDGGEGGDGDAEAGADTAPANEHSDAPEQPPERLKPNPKTGELETVGEKRKPKKRKKAGAK